MNEYKVKLPIFEGPLDLLLHLIRQNEMEISEISISQITSQYLEYLRLMESLDLEVAGDFLVMATSLLNIKLRALLPASEEEEQAEEEEELDNFVSARQLMSRLIEYRKFKEAAHDLGRKSERQAQIFIREVALPALSEAEKDDTIRGDVSTLLDAFTRVLKFVDRRNFHQVQEEEYTVDQKITYLRRQLLVEPRLVLTDVFNQCQAKLEMIVTVIAVLELCRLKELRVRQNDRYGEVFIFRFDSAPEAEFETTQGSKKLAAAAALERIEAEIMASRTGLVDDGVLPPDEDDLLEEMLSGNPPVDLHERHFSDLAPGASPAEAGEAAEEAGGGEIAAEQGEAHQVEPAEPPAETSEAEDEAPAGESEESPVVLIHTPQSLTSQLDEDFENETPADSAAEPTPIAAEQTVEVEPPTEETEPLPEAAPLSEAAPIDEADEATPEALPEPAAADEVADEVAAEPFMEREPAEHAIEPEAMAELADRPTEPEPVAEVETEDEAAPGAMIIAAHHEQSLVMQVPPFDAVADEALPPGELAEVIELHPSLPEPDAPSVAPDSATKPGSAPDETSPVEIPPPNNPEP